MSLGSDVIQINVQPPDEKAATLLLIEKLRAERERISMELDDVTLKLDLMMRATRQKARADRVNSNRDI